MFENVFSLWLLLGRDVSISTSENHRSKSNIDWQIFSVEKRPQNCIPVFRTEGQKRFIFFHFHLTSIT